MTRATILHLAVAAALSSACAATSPAIADTLLRVSSDPGDPVGHGQAYFFTSADGGFSTFPENNGGVRFEFSGGGQRWDLQFAPESGVPLHPGDYENAMRDPFQNPISPGIGVAGNGIGCNAETGRFEIRQLTRASDGSVSAMWVTFESHCNGIVPAIRGELRLNADTSIYVGSPSLVPTYPGRPVQFEVHSTAMAGNIRLSCPSVPGGATFVDRGDGTGLFSWPAGASSPSAISVDFVASDDFGNTATSKSTIYALRPDIFRFRSGVSPEYVFAPMDRGIRLTGYYSGLNVAYQGAGQTWNWILGGQSSPRMEPGVYSFSTNFSVFDQFAPVLQTSMNSSPCAVSSGTFQILAVRYSNDGSPNSLWAKFSQACSGVAQTGEVRIDADTALYVTVPAEIYTGKSNSVSFEILATDAASRPVQLSPSGLPVGAQVSLVGPNRWRFDWVGSDTVGVWPVNFSAQDDQGAVAYAVTSVHVPPIDLVRLRSDPGDPVESGQSVQFTPGQGKFVVGSFDHNIQFGFQGSGHWWTANMVAPRQRQMTPGVYADAARFGQQVLDQPGFEMIGDNRACSSSSSMLQVRKLVYSGSNITSLWATFEQRCDYASGSLRGDLRFNADTAVYIGSPSDFYSLSNQSVDFAISGADTRGLPVRVALSNPPSSAVFQDHGDGTGAFHWCPPGGFDQDQTLRFVIRNTVGDSAYSNTLLHLGRPPLLTISSPPGDPIGGGVQAQFDEGSGSFSSQIGPDSSVTIRFLGSGHRYDLKFMAGANRFPENGENVYGFLSPGQYGIDIRADGDTCTSTYGGFFVRQIHRAPGGTLDAFWSTFSQQCEGGPPLTGEIRYGLDGVVPVLSSLLDARVDGGRVRLRWIVPARQASRLRVWRSESADRWEDRGAVLPDASGYVEFEDPTVRPGGRFGYRLVRESSGEVLSGSEAWVLVPVQALSIRPIGPNPMASPMQFELVLPFDASPQFDVVDVAGRVRVTVRLGWLLAGTHRISLPESAALQPGVYFARLISADRRLVSRVVFLK
jgi:hypothetical protein